MTGKKAALWTDGRYFEQAEMQLDCNWILQKSGKMYCYLCYILVQDYAIFIKLCNTAIGFPIIS